MSAAEAAIRVTIWVALGLYVLAERRGSKRLHTAALVFYLAHVVAVFQFAHGWSHTVAYDYTARRTQDVTGMSVGAGLYVNYAFTVFWAGWVLWLISGRPMSVLGRIGVRAVFLFMLFNSTVVFGEGAVRWYGAILSLVLAAMLLTDLRSRKSL
ncbi:MAG: hypothetical protein K1X57_08375 [Gemmataceae bacterium]|nr:hypothetical protein [Gemmataceae bacterium]